MLKKSAGLLLYREIGREFQVLLGHPGGPFWAKKDLGSWSIIKGEFGENENPFEAALREFQEETGFKPEGEAMPLNPVKQPSGKIVYSWAINYDLNPAKFRSNTFTMEWPPKSGKFQEYPEIDKVEWFPLAEAEQKILKGQVSFIAQLKETLGIVQENTSPENSNDTKDNTYEQGSLFNER